MRGSWDALLRAAKAARRTAILTNTDLIISENGHIRRIKPADLQESASADDGSNPVTAPDACENPRPSRSPSHDRSEDMNLPDAIDAHVRVLPAHLQREALDFIAYLEKRYHIEGMDVPRLTTSAFIERFAGCLGDDFPDEIDDADLPGDAPRDLLEWAAFKGKLPRLPGREACVS
ncbi:MAG: hypothetical protein IPK02_22225 [Candidatus Accumulibacter sp.]|uniref:DUF2281 domain-containing protein n=1 Tax=Candidatus Accumulibacter affinis TaxID=2954384 RepID=A0A935W5G6_9PROT|nr:hypothetical protein [Candidatus Accumulibacter affinis]